MLEDDHVNEPLDNTLKVLCAIDLDGEICFLEMSPCDLAQEAEVSWQEIDQALLDIDTPTELIEKKAFFIFDGKLVVETYQCNHYLDPVEWDMNIYVEGEYRALKPDDIEHFEKLSSLPGPHTWL